MGVSPLEPVYLRGFSLHTVMQVFPSETRLTWCKRRGFAQVDGRVGGEAGFRGGEYV